MTLPDARAIVAYRARLPGGRIGVIGKHLIDGSTPVLYRNYKGAELYKWESYSFDARLIPFLLEAGIVYVDQQVGDTLYRAPLELFLTEGIEAVHSGDEGKQVYLSKDRFRASPMHYKPGFTTKERLITVGDNVRRCECGVSLAPDNPGPQCRWCAQKISPK